MPVHADPIDELRTPRLLLRRIGWADLDDLARLYADARVGATLGGVRTPEESRRALEQLLLHWQEHGFGLWTMREPGTGQFIGRGGLRWVEIDGRPEVEVAYALMPEFWGKGLATELARQSVDLAFARLRLPDLVCFTLPSNHASRRVMEKAGFRYERDMIWKDLPHVLYRLTASAFDPEETAERLDAINR